MNNKKQSPETLKKSNNNFDRRYPPTQEETGYVARALDIES